MRRYAPVLILLATPGWAADFRGQIEILGAAYPSRDLSEARARVFARVESSLGERWFAVASGAVEGVAGTSTREEDGFFRLQDTYVERRGDRVEIRLGVSNVVWGVLDEIQPTDAVNPLDLARFVLDGRAEGRLPVLLARVRVHLPHEWSVEAIVSPLARRGRFDALGESTSPFAPEGFALLPKSDLPATLGTTELGVRLKGTSSGGDWSASYYRDVVDFDRYELGPEGIRALRPVRTMLGGDFETARGDWVLRGEAALVLDDPVQQDTPPRIERETTFQGGLGADRRAGGSTMFLSLLYARTPGGETTNEVSLVGGLTRDFAQGTRTVKAFGIYNALSSSGFLRAVLSNEIVENLRVEVEAGLFAGEGSPTLGLFADSDFVLGRLRFYF